jgi:hypothetical protein
VNRSLDTIFFLAKKKLSSQYKHILKKREINVEWKKSILNNKTKKNLK